jgi:hypothetical protein
MSHNCDLGAGATVFVDLPGACSCTENSAPNHYNTLRRSLPVCSKLEVTLATKDRYTPRQPTMAAPAAA